MVRVVVVEEKVNEIEKIIYSCKQIKEITLLLVHRLILVLDLRTNIRNNDDDYGGFLFSVYLSLTLFHSYSD